MLFRDGTLYFIILLVMNVIVVLRNNIPSWEMYDFASPFLETFTSIIICRFILNLRQVGADDDFEVSGCQSTVVRFVANLGQSVGIGGWDADDVESEGTYRPESMELGKVADKGLQHKDHVGMNSLEAATTEPEQRVA
ncbi:hypothetical protein BC835DRAFT_1423748 [Cytidiella melzeri]|nr:hypothetical protein BC835DRAFT_1423748 [Cytidiella melzeri]